jgi:hypothetical protein
MTPHLDLVVSIYTKDIERAIKSTDQIDSGMVSLTNLPLRNLTYLLEEQSALVTVVNYLNKGIHEFVKKIN